MWAGVGLGKDLILSELYTRADDFSFQIMAKGSARLFVRVTSPKSSTTPMVFSDFILDSDDDDRAIEALHLLKGQGFPLSPAMKLVFQDIYPSYSDETDCSELIRRHDQIVSVVKAYAAQAGLSVENSFLETKAGVFETVVLIQ